MSFNRNGRSGKNIQNLNGIEYDAKQKKTRMKNVVVFEKDVIVEGKESFKDKEGNPIDFGDGNGVVIQVEEDITLESPNPSWQVPKLTIEQVYALYNAFIVGKHCVVRNADDTVAYAVITTDVSTSKPSVVLSNCWLGMIDYQIVEITPTEEGEEPTEDVVITGHSFTN